MKVCQEKTDGSGREWSLGVASAAEWTLISEKPVRLQIKYSKGDEENGKTRSVL